jgi:nicotinamidase-related amidase
MEIIVVMCPQNSFLDPKGSLYMGEKAEILKVRLIDYLSEFKGKKIFFREKHAEADTFFSNDRTHSVDYNICDCFKGCADLFFDKIRYSGFYETSFDVFLKQNHVQSVILAGVETHTSILFTSEELRNRRVDVTILEPLTLARDGYMHCAALSLMINNLGVRVSA